MDYRCEIPPPTLVILVFSSHPHSDRDADTSRSEHPTILMYGLPLLGTGGRDIRAAARTLTRRSIFNPSICISARALAIKRHRDLAGSREPSFGSAQ